MKRTEILIGGVGGQGVILAGILLGSAATLFDGKKAVQTQAYSSEQRGGMARAEVILDEEPVTDPQVRKPDILIALAQDAVNRHLLKIKPGGLLVADSDLVLRYEKGNFDVLSLPATSIADKEMGNTVVANLVLLGGLIKKTGILSVEAMEKAIAANVPPKAKELNLKAFRRGLEMQESDADERRFAG
ncbi:MAG TPA: 2-oxoacid:acceptor oxidoreductase family protein [Thermodesulfobacteriota bacterium]|nr:2-oxoacid:acceptor oxidoreductase family protein [Thermodesulfobacteriota bacterium]